MDIQIYTRSCEGYNEIKFRHIADGIKYELSGSYVPDYGFHGIVISALPANAKNKFKYLFKTRNSFATKTWRTSLKFFVVVMELLREEFPSMLANAMVTDKRRLSCYANWLKKNQFEVLVAKDYQDLTGDEDLWLKFRI